MRQAVRVRSDSRRQALFSGEILPGDRGLLFLYFFQGEITGKELDTETGYYYFGARYLDPKTSRWISVDPAMGDYIPSAPVNDEARKRNGNLPGQGGVFNYVNLHVYHYAGNNPVKYVDPDGNKNIPILHVFEMDVGVWASEKIKNDPDNFTINSAGCAIVGMADLSHTAGGNLNPSNINASYVVNGKIDWGAVAKAIGLTNLGKISGKQFTKSMYDMQDSSYSKYYTFANVNYEPHGKPHWVGVNGIVTREGTDYISITGTSSKDSKDIEFTIGTRGTKGWIKEGNNILVPMSEVKEYQRFLKYQSVPDVDRQ